MRGRAGILGLTALLLLIVLWALTPSLLERPMHRALGQLREEEHLVVAKEDALHLDHRGAGLGLFDLILQTTSGRPVVELSDLEVQPCPHLPPLCLEVGWIAVASEGVKTWGGSLAWHSLAAEALRQANFQALEGHRLEGRVGLLVLEPLLPSVSTEAESLKEVRLAWSMPAPGQGLLALEGSGRSLRFAVRSFQDSLQVQATLELAGEGTAGGVASFPAQGWERVAPPRRAWTQRSGPGGPATERWRELLGFGEAVRE